MARLATYRWQEAFEDVEAIFSPPPAQGFRLDDRAALAHTVREFQLDVAMRVLATRIEATGFSAPHLPLSGDPPRQRPAWVVLILGEVLDPSPLPPGESPLSGLSGGAMVHAVICAETGQLLVAVVLPVELTHPN